MLKTTGAAVAGLSLLGVDAMATGKADSDSNSTLKSIRRKKILVIGAHPDDPESGCGGTMARFIEAGHEVVNVYLTRGERGIKGKGLEESASIRTKEALAACETMGSRPLFLSQVDGACEITPDRYTEMINVIKAENPDIVLTHWPIDAHRDHAICSILVLDAWRRVGRTFDLFFFEVMPGTQTKTFMPTDFVDITKVREKKIQTCWCHESQGAKKWFDGYHTDIERFRGMQAGCRFAEAFVRFDQSPTNTLLTLAGNR